MAEKNSTELIIRMLESHGGSLRPDQVDKELCGTIIPEKDYKKWWDKAKKVAREGGRIVVPSKRTEPLILRDANISPLDSLVAEFREARELKMKSSVLDSLKNESAGLAENLELLYSVTSEIDECVKKALKLQLGQALDLLACRDELFVSVEGSALPDGSREC